MISVTFSTFLFYRQVFRGKLTEAEYSASVNRAYAEIVSQTNGQALRASEAMSRQIQMCECEIVDVMHSFSKFDGGVTSINNDGFSVSRSANAHASESEIVHQICARYLQCPENLMSRWI